MSNAIKYTERGQIMVSVDWKIHKPKTPGGTTVLSGLWRQFSGSQQNVDWNAKEHGIIEITVTDTGAGIASHKLTQLCKLFTDDSLDIGSDDVSSIRKKSTRSKNTYTKLAGLGLSISQKLCQQLGS